jgi:hypothetical protein
MTFKMLFIYWGWQLVFSSKTRCFRVYKTERYCLSWICFDITRQFTKTRQDISAALMIERTLRVLLCVVHLLRKTACLRGLARHFKTEPTETVALCFVYPKTLCLPAEGKLCSSVDEFPEKMNRPRVLSIMRAARDYGLKRIAPLEHSTYILHLLRLWTPTIFIPVAFEIHINLQMSLEYPGKDLRSLQFLRRPMAIFL